MWTKSINIEVNTRVQVGVGIVEKVIQNEYKVYRGRTLKGGDIIYTDIYRLVSP